MSFVSSSQGRAYLWAAGFSLSFGAMFTKTYRVHQIFRRANRGLVKSKVSGGKRCTRSKTFSARSAIRERVSFGLWCWLCHIQAYVYCIFCHILMLDRIVALKRGVSVGGQSTRSNYCFVAQSGLRSATCPGEFHEGCRVSCSLYCGFSNILFQC